MSKSLLSIFCFFSFAAVSWGCKQGADIPNITTNLPPDIDGITRDIPQERKSKHEQQLKQKVENSLGLQDLQNGFNGLEIRIWQAEGLSYNGQLFLLRNDGSSWKGESYFFRDSFSYAGKEDGRSSYEGATAVEKHELKQTSREWKQFVNELFDLQIEKLRDFRQIPEFSLGTDEGGILVEIAQDKIYKVYEIPTPSARREIEDAQKAAEILKLVDHKFSNKLKRSTEGG